MTTYNFVHPDKSRPETRKKRKMYKKRTATYMNFEQKNRTSVGTGLTVVPALVERKLEKKTEKCVFYSLLVQSLNRKPVFVQFGQQKSASGEKVPFQPAMKRVKRESDESAEDSDATVEVPENEKIIKRDGSYGTILEPFSKIWVTTFDRAGCLTVDSSSIVKIAISAETYQGNISYKATEVKNEDIKSITTPVFQKYFQNTPMTVIPTTKNIAQPMDQNPKYYSRSFMLPLSDDTPIFKDVEICVDPEDRKRFYCTQKDSDRQFVGVNTDVGEGKTRNNLSVVYEADQKYFMKYAYMNDAWSCFGVQDVDMWAKSAGRLMFNAKGWYAFGSSKLDDIKSMRANADADEGDAGGADYGYGAYGMDMDDIQNVSAQEADVGSSASDDMVASTGFVSSMSLDLAKTAEAAGIELSKEYIKKHYGPDGFFNYNPDGPTNPINAGWRTRIGRGEHGVTFNFTEMNDDIRPGFIRETADKKIKFYGVFPVGDDRPYEQVRAEGGNLEQFLEENKLFPSTIFAVTE